MSKRKTKQNKTQRPAKRAPQTKKRMSILVALILGIATLVGGLAAVFAFFPRVAVVPSDPVDSYNPFSASFTIINTSIIPLWEVDASVGIGQIVPSGAPFDPNLIANFKTRFVKVEWKNHKLNMDDRFTITPGDLINFNSSVQMRAADIAIVVSFKPWILPFKREKVFRFVARKQTNKLFYWYSLPVGAKYILDHK